MRLRAELRASCQSNKQSRQVLRLGASGRKRQEHEEKAGEGSAAQVGRVRGKILRQVSEITGAELEK